MPQPSSLGVRVDDGHVLQGGDRGAEVDALVGGHGDVLRAVGVLRGFEDVAAAHHVVRPRLASCVLRIIGVSRPVYESCARGSDI